MALIPIQPNLLVNTESIDMVKIVKDSQGLEKVVVTVNNKNFNLEVPLKEFLLAVMKNGTKLNQQFWSI